ncbi:unnamed protein product [Clonostachys rosea]|uniref:S-adenosyl-L-methionine-dependent N-methyltransferase n=1 Tax=Bionectria ochroleuca TaxID=29856 RepID=A0ABY6UDB2_BIOOC|nr:unnamed protein product [Clonostachys rosea]
MRETLPSLLLFGPQTEFPTPQVLKQVRTELTSNKFLSTLVDAVDDLPQFWQELTRLDPDLQSVPGTKYLGLLRHWVREGKPLFLDETHLPNHFVLPVTILLQITQYTQYLSRVGAESHSKVLESVKAGGIQGFCVGFLSAIAVASSRTEGDLGTAVASAIRLAVGIGAYVDRDGAYSSQPTEYKAIAIRWKEGHARGKEDAYISSINDDGSVTVTAKASDIEGLILKTREQEFRTSPVHVQGRFHTADYRLVAEKLMKFESLFKHSQFADATALQAAVRDTATGERIEKGSLSRFALQNTLLDVADWYKTLSLSLEGIKGFNQTIAFAGSGYFIPKSLFRDSGAQLINLGSVELSGTDFGTGFPTSQENINGMTNGITSIHDVQDHKDMSKYPSHSIAVVGMAGRFPGADSVDELWKLITEGKTTVEPAPVERLHLPQTGDHANTKWWGNFLNNPDAFDHKFFKKSSREAIAWDPQQRILLEVIYEALESASYFGPSATSEPLDYGCYIGAVMNNYYDNLSCHAGTAYATVGTSRCYLSGCMSHYFGWTGPSLTIDTACSSSLVAINTACRAIWSGECSRAIAGGTNVICSPFDYQNLSAAGFLSPSGQCKPFDADADGYCRGEGVAVVVLKPLKDAIDAKDNILGVVVGSAANQNHNFSHITAPYSGSQVELYQKVMELGNVQPESVTYVEAHGTGTGVGDPIEVRSIRDAFGGPTRDSVLHFGSIKGNIGHTEATAGIAGLIKVLLMMRHRKITAQASFKSLNPKLPAFDQHQMAISRKEIPWEASSLIACVNSYGAAGSNSAVIVRQMPVPISEEHPAPLSKYPIFISAGSSNGLSRYCQKLLSWLGNTESVSRREDILGSLSFNLADRGNHSLPFVLCTAVSSISDLETKLQGAVIGSGIAPTEASNPVVLVFGGQESESIGLSRELYNSSKIFRKHLDSIDAWATSSGLESLYPSIFETSPVKNLVTLHTSLFAVQYASAKAWIDCGLKINAVVGHSFGQLTALCVSGALSLPDALTLVSGRASLMQQHWGSEAGSMLFVAADRKTVRDIIQTLEAKEEDFYAEIACYNGPKSHVVVGSADSIQLLQSYVSSTPHLRDAIRTKRLNVTNGFHSQFTEPMLPHLESLSQRLQWGDTEIQLETTNEYETKDAFDFSIVAKHTRQPVFFQQAVERLTSRFTKCTWIEAGRGSSVMQLVKGSVGNPEGHSFYSPQLTSTNAQDSLADITVDLWKKGYSTQYWPFHRIQKEHFNYLSLPPIQFEKTRHWLGFTGRGTVENEGAAKLEESTTSPPTLLKFVDFQDASKMKAVFQIDPRADRFQTMLGGHVMAGQTLAPASLYYEVVSRAALFLENDVEALSYVPTVDDLFMASPIGSSTSKKITLLLSKLDTASPSWSFSITTQDTDIEGAEPFEHSTGRVYLKKRDDKQAARDFERFETLTGYRRYQNVMNHPDAEKMQGKHVYRAFNTVVYYGQPFQGIKSVSCVGSEAAGIVRITPPVEDPTDQRLCDTPMTDSFMQFAGFLVNYFNNPSMDDVFVCNKIEHIEIGGSFDPDAGEWLIYSTMSEGGAIDATADAYIFDSRTKKMVMAAFGFQFSKMSQNLLARVLKSVNKSKSAKTIELADDRKEAEAYTHATEQSTSMPAARKSVGKRQELFQIISNVTDVPVDDLKDDSSLDDLGVDSLMATEVLNDIRAAMGVTIDLSSFLFFPNIKAIVSHVDEKLGLAGEEEEDDENDDSDSARASSSDTQSTPITRVTTPGIGGSEKERPKGLETADKPTIISAYEAFEATRLRYDHLAETTQAVGFWEKAYPHQARLVLAYVVEAFADLGCDVRNIPNGGQVPQVTTLSKHSKLVRQLYRVLEDGNLVKESAGFFTRTKVPVDPESAESIYNQTIDLFPQHATVNKLVRAVGSEMAACLRGDKEGIQVVFGNRENKKTLEEMYEFWPLLRTPTLVLGSFLLKAFTNSTGSGKFRILEIGAGTGGTTRYLLSVLRAAGIDFEYVFTDLSSSLVTAASKQFKGMDDISFDVLDIEQPPKAELEGAFHCVIATNCIHATRNLEVSLKHIRKMLRTDGFLSLIEITNNMYWLDIVVGLFEGWWLFEDGRQHALIDEKDWERRMKAAGFGEVSWSEGATPESKTVRVITAFPAQAKPMTVGKSVKASIETVVYKTIGGQDIHADIYCPITDNESPIQKRKIPIALMIHGGSHMLFSRKDVRPAQTRLLLNKGFLPVSLDYRLCPEVPLAEGAMTDVCDALEWARNQLPHLKLPQHGFEIDGEKVVVVGWSSGGQLAMSLAWTAPQQGLPPPSAILAFYAPTDYEDPWWQNPIYPNGAPYKGLQYDVLEGVEDAAITNYEMVGAWEEPIADPRSQEDARCRIVFHINWKAQTLPVIMNGLPSRKMAAEKYPDVKDWDKLPQPSVETIKAHSPRAHIDQGDYNVPTFFVHGKSDDLIPWQQSNTTYQAMRERGLKTGLALLEGAPHICDLSSDPESDGWKATLKAYDFICSSV